MGRGPLRFTIPLRGVRVRLGTFNIVEEAARAYNGEDEKFKGRKLWLTSNEDDDCS